MEKLIYENPLMTEEDVKDFVLEGEAHITFENQRMRLKNKLDFEIFEQKANYVFWCPIEFPNSVKIEFDFFPIQEPGLCMLMFAAKGAKGEDIFQEGLLKRTGEYDCYLHGDINLYHLSYFRRMYDTERAFHICQLRKSNGGHKLEAGGDPIPNIKDCINPYHITLIKKDGHILFYINDLKVIDYVDNGVDFGEALTNGKIGFRQMASTIAEYSNLKVYEI